MNGPDPDTGLGVVPSPMKIGGIGTWLPGRFTVNSTTFFTTSTIVRVRLSFVTLNG